MNKGEKDLALCMIAEAIEDMCYSAEELAADKEKRDDFTGACDWLFVDVPSDFAFRYLCGELGFAYDHLQRGIATRLGQGPDALRGIALTIRGNVRGGNLAAATPPRRKGVIAIAAA